MVERGFARMFGNFSTIFVIVAVVVFPLHLAYAFAFRGVIATSDWHDEIAALPDDARVGDVRPQQLDNARVVFWLLTLGELALVPFAVRATRRVFDVEDRGGVATATDAWADAFRRQGPRRYSRSWVAATGVGLATAAACGLLLHGIGQGVTAFLSAEWRWIGETMTAGVARAGALPFFLGPVAASSAKEQPPPAPKLY